MRFYSGYFTFLTLGLLALQSSSGFAATYHHRTFDPKAGGSVCYSRIYSDAFLKKNPSVKVKTISMERRNSVSGSIPNSKKKFGITFGATTATEDYNSNAECKPKGNLLACQLENDGGSFTILKSGKTAIVKTRRITIDGVFSGLSIAAKPGAPNRSFTLRGNGKTTCAAVFD